MAIVHKIHIPKLRFLVPDVLCPQGSSLTPVFSILSWSGVPVISSKRLTEVIFLSSQNWESFAFLLEWQCWVENSQVALDTSEAFVLSPSAFQSWLFLQDLFDLHPFFFLPCISICTFKTYFRKAFWMISGHNYTFFLSLVFSRDTYYIQVGSLWFSSAIIFLSNHFSFLLPQFILLHFLNSALHSADVSSTTTSSSFFPPALSQFLLFSR